MQPAIRLPLPPSSPPATLLYPVVSPSLQYPRRRSVATSVSTSSPPSTGIEILQPPTPPLRPSAPSTPPSVDSPSAAYWDYQFLFLSQRSETAAPVPLRAVAGSVPADFPRGTYYLTGPGLFTDDHGSTVHPLDGHGYLRAFRFDGEGEVLYSAKYVKTEAQREETASGGGEWRFTHRGPFSVLRGGRKLGNVKVMKNVANTSVVMWGGKLMCLWEGGNPYEIDRETLETLGTVDLVGKEGGFVAAEGPRRRRSLVDMGVDVAAGLLKPLLYGVFRMPPKRLLSHYKIDPKRGRLLMLSCNAEDMLLPRSNFTFYEFDSNFELKQKREFVIPDQFMIHDWAFTDNHYIVIGNRIKLDVPGSMLAVTGLSPMISALSVNPSQPTSPIYLLPRSDDVEAAGSLQRDWRVPIEAPSQFWVLHVSNAFEEEEEEVTEKKKKKIRLHASVCSYRWFNFQKMFGYNWKTGRLNPGFMNDVQDGGASLPHLVEVSIELDAEGEHGRCSVNTPSDEWKRAADFPAINPAYTGLRNEFTYAGASSGTRRFLPHFPFDTVLKFNCSDGSVASWWAGERSFIGEPVFMARDGADEEDDGYILVVEYAVSKQRCYLVILDARLVGKPNAMVAKLEIPKHLNFPMGFHGFWQANK